MERVFNIGVGYLHPSMVDPCRHVRSPLFSILVLTNGGATSSNGVDPQHHQRQRRIPVLSVLCIQESPSLGGLHEGEVAPGGRGMGKSRRG